jgi:hypothetical protein
MSSSPVPQTPQKRQLTRFRSEYFPVGLFRNNPDPIISDDAKALAALKRELFARQMIVVSVGLEVRNGHRHIPRACESTLGLARTQHDVRPAPFAGQ